MRRFSVAGRAGLAAAAGVVAGALAAVGAMAIGAPAGLAVAVALLVGLPPALLLTARLFVPLRRVLRALEDGIAGYHEGDFSLRLGVDRDDEVGDLVRLYNQLGEVMSTERRDLRQRELMLASVLEATPTAVLVVNPVGRVLVANRAAREMLAGGGRIEGRTLRDVVAENASELGREMETDGDGDGLVSLPVEDGHEVLQVSRRGYTLNARRHRLLLVRRLTPELRRQEAAVWKRVIRVVGHEINNSLAPIRSLVASGRRLLVEGDPSQRLPEVLDTIEVSADRLHRFVDGYRRVARLPAPRLEPVDLADFLDDVRRLEEIEIAPPGGPVSAVFDPSQLQQVILNLVRNAREAGSASVEVAASSDGHDLVIEVRDRGPGMAPEELTQALVPFWTTKPEGSGLGLALCREILESHRGSLRLRAREGGGLVVTCRLPLEAG